MPGFTIQRQLAAAPDAAFALFADFEGASDHVEGIVGVELLTPGPVRKGTRFRETRSMLGKQVSEVLEVTAFDPPRAYTVEATSHGTHFVSEFRFRPSGTGTDLTLHFDAHPQTTMAKLMSRLSLGTMRKFIEKDIDALARALEGRDRPAQA